MAIIETITNEWHFADWCKQAQARDSDYGHFTTEGAKALQAYFDNLSDDLGENIEFDPIAWCVEFTEYTPQELTLAVHEAHGGDKDMTYPEILDWYQDRTTVIEFDSGVIIGEF